MLVFSLKTMLDMFYFEVRLQVLFFLKLLFIFSCYFQKPPKVAPKKDESDDDSSNESEEEQEKKKLKVQVVFIFHPI